MSGQCEDRTGASHLFREAKEDTGNQLHLSADTVADEHSKETASTALVIRGYFFLAFLIVSDTVGLSCAQALGGIIPVFELNLWRFMCQLLLVLALIIPQGMHILPQKKHVMYLIGRCLHASWYNSMVFTAVLYLPVGTQAGLQESFTMIFTGLIAVILWRKCELPVMCAVVICIIGIILVTQPAFIFQGTLLEHSSSGYHPVCKVQLKEASGDQNESIFTPNDTTLSFYNATEIAPSDDKPQEIIGYILTLSVSASCSIMLYVMSIKLSDLDPFASSFWVAAAGICIAVTGMMIFEHPSLPGSTACWLLLFGHALAAAYSSIAYNVILQVVPPITYRLIYSMKVALTFFAQYVVLAKINRGSYNAVNVVGAVLIFLGNGLIPVYRLCKMLQEDRKSKRAATDREKLISDSEIHLHQK